MRKNFLAGLALLLPAVLTGILVMFFVNLLTAPFVDLVRLSFEKLGLLDRSYFFLSGQQVVQLTSKILVLLTLVLSTLLIGFFAQHLFLDRVVAALDRLIHNIPVVNKIYKAFQEVLSTIFSPTNTSFSQIVIVPYPHANTYAIGLIAKDAVPEGSDQEHLGLISVFVPGTPNPTIGFNLLYKREQLIFVDMPVDEALKFIVSCGVKFSGFNQK